MQHRANPGCRHVHAAHAKLDTMGCGISTVGPTIAVDQRSSLPAVPVPGPPITEAAWGNVLNVLVRPRVVTLVPVAVVTVNEATGGVIPKQGAMAFDALALALWPVGVVGWHSGHPSSGLVGGDGHDLGPFGDSLVAHIVGIARRPVHRTTIRSVRSLQDSPCKRDWHGSKAEKKGCRKGPPPDAVQMSCIDHWSVCLVTKQLIARLHKSLVTTHARSDSQSHGNCIQNWQRLVSNTCNASAFCSDRLCATTIKPHYRH